MSDQFYFGTPDDTDSDLFDNDDTLPFPKPLERSAFLKPDFSPAEFLSSLSDRFQTLEDLQNELRELAQSLNKELIDLVNNNYQDFLSLGSTLAGGEEKVEEVRVGLLGFQRDVNGVRDKVVSRKTEVSKLLNQKRETRKEINEGVNLLQFAERLDDLEYRLGIVQSQPHKHVSTDDPVLEIDDRWDGNFEEDGPEFDEATGIPRKLVDSVQRYRILQFFRRRHNSAQPFLMSQSNRSSKILETIQLDLDSAIRQESDVKMKQKIIQLKAILDD